MNADGTKTLVNKHDDDDNLPENEFALIQYNFSLFFGIAVQLYEATLVSDDTPWDRFRRDHPAATDPALNPWTNETPEHISRLALFGAHLFNDRTRIPAGHLRCSNCHESHELTDASVRRVALAPNGPVRNRDGNVIDKGFNNIGVRPTDNDLGVGATDAFGPLSFSRRLFPGGAPIGQMFDGAVVDKGFGVEGAFKVPSLRNVALTAPYFHNGDVLTLRQVVELYGRGGNVFPVNELDGTVIEPLGLPADAKLRRDRRACRLPGDALPTTGSYSSAHRSIIRSSSCLTDIQETPTQPPMRTATAWPTMCWSKSPRSAPRVAIRFRAFSKGFSGRPLDS